MKTMFVFLFTTIASLAALAEVKIVNAHFSKKSIVVQLQDSETGRTKWISSATVGIINETLRCSEENCTAINLRIQNNGVYGDVALLNENSLLTQVFLVHFYEDTLINPKDLNLSKKNGIYLISIRVR